IDTRLLRRRPNVGGVMMCDACHPGQGNGAPRKPGRELVPFLKGEYVPKMSEQTIGASGPSTGRITRTSPRFHHELVPNWNTDIEFRDEEESNEDRFYDAGTCKERLDNLAIRVANQWVRVKLKVLEAWDEGNDRLDDPLHYEGRAVDITTNDQDRRKYPMLARLAVEAGFDWVYYNDNIVHCSVKSDESDEAKYGGCFPGESTVYIPRTGPVTISSLQPGDQVLAVGQSGQVVIDTFLQFMHAQSDIREMVEITTENGRSLVLTKNHLIYTTKRLGQDLYDTFLSTWMEYSSPTAAFAGKVREGDYIYALHDTEQLTLSSSVTVRPARVLKIRTIESASGAYAPLTQSGTILVDGVAASCYAVIESDVIAHAVVSPYRYYLRFSLWFSGETNTINTVARNKTRSRSVQPMQGISLYSKLLYRIFSRIL
uniref:Hedgehog protein n=1 Tax=Ciona savignyi TaxID=51511 RepID=H2YWW4_CIOSA